MIYLIGIIKVKIKKLIKLLWNFFYIEFSSFLTDYIFDLLNKQYKLIRNLNYLRLN